MYDTDEARAMAQKKLDFFFGVVSDMLMEMRELRADVASGGQFADPICGYQQSVLLLPTLTSSL